MKAFGGRLYRPDVAPADVADEPADDGNGAAAIAPPQLPASSSRTVAAAAKKEGNAKPAPVLANPLFEINAPKP
jgi:hypothetical protein